LRDPAFDGEARLRPVLTGIFLAIALGGAIDLALDRPETFWSVHVIFEVALLVFSLGAVARAVERDAWRARTDRLLRGLGEEIDLQLRDWGLTPTERETALLLLKGYGHKEIAALQEKSERTVRQHAIAVYRKSGLSGRAELSAFFLEDLLLPLRETEVVADAARG
jgi:DNA-binding CsgD family transcriptional regulator